MSHGEGLALRLAAGGVGGNGIKDQEINASISRNMAGHSSALWRRVYAPQRVLFIIQKAPLAAVPSSSSTGESSTVGSQPPLGQIFPPVFPGEDFSDSQKDPAKIRSIFQISGSISMEPRWPAGFPWPPKNWIGKELVARRVRAD